MAIKKQGKKQGKKQPEKAIYWNSDLTGRMRVYAQEVQYKKNGNPASFLKFSTSLGIQDDEGDWYNLYFNVRFMKGDSPEVDGGMIFEIEIAKAFLTFEIFQNKTGEVIKTPVIVVQEWADPDRGEEDDPF